MNAQAPQPAQTVSLVGLRPVQPAYWSVWSAIAEASGTSTMQPERRTPSGAVQIAAQQPPANT